MNWHSNAIEMFKNGKTISQISKELNINYNTVKSFLRRFNKRDKAYIKSPQKPLTSNSRYFYANGIGTYEDEITIINGQDVTPELIMKAKCLKADEWEVISFTRNIWQQQTKEGNTIDLCQSKLSVKPKKNVDITFEDIDNYFSKKEKPKIEFEMFEYDENGEVLEIDVADLHDGLLSWKSETGKDFDLKICSKMFLSAIFDISIRAKNKKIKKIYFCTLGDIIHIDNDKNETTKGTVQQADGRIAKIFDNAVDVMKNAINLILELNIPVEYVYTCGNHDRNTGYFLVKCLECTYANNPNIKFDTLPNPQKKIHFGNVLVGLTHGDMPNKNKGSWIINDFRKDFGNSLFVEEHCGHIHTEEAKIINGIMVRSIMAQCGNSYWEHQQGYRSERGLMCFIWNENKGLRETWYYYF